MHLLIVTVFFAAVGVPMNLIVMYVARANSEKIAIAKLLIIHLSFANIVQLISRIFTIVIPDNDGICYPMSSLCKLSLWFLVTSRKVSILFTFYLGVFRLRKIKNKSCFSLTNTCLHVALPVNWIILNFTTLPPVILIPDDRPIQLNVTEGCICSISYSMTDKDTFVRLYDLVVGVGSLYFLIALTVYVSIRMVMLLLKHKKTVFIQGTLNRIRTRHQDIIAIKAVMALLMCYSMCCIASSTIRFLPHSDIFQIGIIIGDLYGVFSPFILGLGYPSFRKALSGKCHIRCQKLNKVQAATIS